MVIFIALLPSHFFKPFLTLSPSPLFFRLSPPITALFRISLHLHLGHEITVTASGALGGVYVCVCVCKSYFSLSISLFIPSDALKQRVFAFAPTCGSTFGLPFHGLNT